MASSMCGRARVSARALSLSQKCCPVALTIARTRGNTYPVALPQAELGRLRRRRRRHRHGPVFHLRSRRPAAPPGVPLWARHPRRGERGARGRGPRGPVRMGCPCPAAAAIGRGGRRRVRIAPTVARTQPGAGPLRRRRRQRRQRRQRIARIGQGHGYPDMLGRLLSVLWVQGTAAAVAASGDARAAASRSKLADWYVACRASRSQGQDMRNNPNKLEVNKKKRESMFPPGYRFSR
jgi:hypothetical protein